MASVNQSEAAVSESLTDHLILGISIISIAFAFTQYYIISLTPVEVYAIEDDDEENELLPNKDGLDLDGDFNLSVVNDSAPGARSRFQAGQYPAQEKKIIPDKKVLPKKKYLPGDKRAIQNALLNEIYEAIRTGAAAFLYAEYSICTGFAVVFSFVILSLVSWGQSALEGKLTAFAFVLGAVTSMISGYLGMQVAVFSNARTCVNAQKPGFTECFNTAFRAGAVMGFALNGLGLFVLYVTLCFFKTQYGNSDWAILMECVSGYGLGGSTVAMFGRVGGGIFTKAGIYYSLHEIDSRC